MKSPDWGGHNTDWSLHHVPCSWVVMLENALDPSHAPYLHEGLLGTRQSAAPMQMSLINEGVWPPAAASGFQLHHSGYIDSQQEDGMRAVRTFQPPCTIR